MKKINLVVFLAVFLVIISSCLQGAREERAQEKNNETGVLLSEVLEEIPVEDFAKIDYSIYIENRLVETSDEKLSEKIEDKELLRLFHPFGFEPLTFIIDSPWVNYRISDAVKEMEVGSVRNVSIPAEFSAFGTYNKELVRDIPRFTFIPKIEKMSKTEYLFFYGKEPALNDNISEDYWNSTITEIENESITILRLPANNSIIEGSIGNITITVNETTIIMELTPILNKTVIARTGEMVRITDYNETMIIADFNHPFAGKNLTFEIKLLEKGELKIWSRSLEDAINANIGIVEFYSFTCVDCLRFEREAVTSPEVLALKDRVKFVKINGEIEKELVKRYNITSYPTILILKKGEEIGRITSFISGIELRSAVEQVAKN